MDIHIHDVKAIEQSDWEVLCKKKFPKTMTKTIKIHTNKGELIQLELYLEK